MKKTKNNPIKEIYLKLIIYTRMHIPILRWLVYDENNEIHIVIFRWKRGKFVFRRDFIVKKVCCEWNIDDECSKMDKIIDERLRSYEANYNRILNK